MCVFTKVRQAESGIMCFYSKSAIFTSFNNNNRNRITIEPITVKHLATVKYLIIIITLKVYRVDDIPYNPE